MYITIIKIILKNTNFNKIDLFVLECLLTGLVTMVFFAQCKPIDLNIYLQP